MTRKRKTRPAPEPMAEGSARIDSSIQEQQRLLAAAIASLEAAGVEDVHRGRVAARRLRSLLKTFRPLLDARRARLYRIDLRSFARSLGAVREADVRKDLLMTLVRGDAAISAADRRRLGVLLDDLCIAARETLQRHQREPGALALRRALERHAASSGRVVTRDVELAGVMTLAGRAWRRPVRLLKVHPESAAELHELRLAFKHCRYALEAVADIAPKAAERLLRRLRAAQDMIGEHRDTLLAEHWVRLYERAIGRVFADRLCEGLARRERRLRRQSAGRADKVLPAWRAWRDATRKVRRGRTPGPA